ncbi:Fur-regulated basic protein FbpA [Neobacillus niacini]|uniref:Fur-regulated basic protein FbpA n=1 Tax=Neobacillus niacini TaxID=86668 RepID=UPI003B02E66B
MKNQLRKGIETLKLFYINRLIESGLYNASDDELHSLTLSELQTIFKKTFPLKKSNQCKEN